MCWSRKIGSPPSTSSRLISAMASAPVPSGSEMASPSGPVCTWAPKGVVTKQAAGRVGVRALDLDLEGGAGQEAWRSGPGG